MPIKSQEIEKLIKISIPDAVVKIVDLAGDENHYSAEIKSKEFKGKNKIDQQTNIWYFAQHQTQVMVVNVLWIKEVDWKNLLTWLNGLDLVI